MASLEKLWLQMQYCNLVLENVVTELPLILLTKEILAEKGALPVGEIGKVLTEYTSIPNLSMKLKEIFGGLKKFLEMYTDRFVILNDHPFNPHVVLRSALTPQQLEMFERGIFPTQIVIKSKKVSLLFVCLSAKHNTFSLYRQMRLKGRRLSLYLEVLPIQKLPLHRIVVTLLIHHTLALNTQLK